MGVVEKCEGKGNPESRGKGGDVSYTVTFYAPKKKRREKRKANPVRGPGLPTRKGEGNGGEVLAIPDKKKRGKGEKAPVEVGGPKMYSS